MSSRGRDPRLLGGLSVARSKIPRAGASTSRSLPYFSRLSRGCGRGGPTSSPGRWQPPCRWRPTTGCRGSGTSCLVGWGGASRGGCGVGLDPGTLLAIVLMARATYATRAGGLWLANRFELSERAGAWLDAIPGAILVSLVAPTVLASGPAEALAAVAVVVVALRSGSLPLAMATGVVAVVLLRAVVASLA